MSDTAVHCPACGHSIPYEAASCASCGASLGTGGDGPTTFARLRVALAHRYSIERHLGHGGMAIVYLARDLKHDRAVALKVLQPELASGLGPERFLREIQVAAHLQHPHILSLLDSGTFEWGPGRPGLYYVMPYAKDESLRERLRREVQFALHDAIQITCEVAGALDYAHRQGVVHRDIKPENILLSDAHALVSDFGIARAVHTSADESLTASGLVVGTPAYMSPEQGTGERAIDARSDIYSLGCVLYEMLVGETPYTGTSAQAIIARRLREPVPHIRTVRENVPERVERVVRKALAKVPADRFATASEMAEALQAPKAARRTSRATTKVQPGPPHGRRKRLWTGIMAGLVVVGLAVGWAVWRSAARPRQTLSPTRVAVLPFSSHGGEASKQLSRAVITLLSTALDGVGELHTVDPVAVLAAPGVSPDAPWDQVRAGRVAGRLGAGRYVVGDIVEGTDGHITISASAYDVTSGRLQGQRATVEGSGPTQVFRLVNELVVQLLGAFDIQETPPRLESISTGSILALNEYLKGENDLSRGDYVEGARAFGRAVEADSLFALAWFRLSYALTFTESSGNAEQPMLRALALRDRLSERDRRLAEAFSAGLEVDPKRADRLYRAFVYEYPDDVEGWFGRADVMLHFGPLYGLGMDSLSQAFERVLFLDPHHSEAQAHLPWAAGLDQRLGLLDSATTRALATDANGYYAPVFRILRAFARRDSAAETQAISTAPTMDDLQRLLVVNMTATLQEPQGTQRLARRLFMEPSRLPEVRAFGHLMAAHLELARGRLRAATVELAAADTLDPASALEDRALLLLPPFLEATDSSARAVRSRLERWNAAATPPSISANPWLVPHDSVRQQIRLYLLGTLGIRLKEAAAAQRYATRLLRFDSASTQGVIGRALGHEILAQGALAEGSKTEALAELDRSGLRGPKARVWERAYSSPFFSQSYGRYLRAGVLSELGRNAEALRWYNSLWMANAFDLIYLAPARLRQAEIHERLGDRVRAAEYYRAFVALWKEADPELQWRVKQAEKRIEELQKKQM
jgi:tetratricopeptide (TPR) repeat protein